MQKDEDDNYQRVDVDAPISGFGIEFDIFSGFKKRIFTAEAPDQEVKEAKEDNNTEEIRQQAVNVSQDIVFQKMETGNQSFREINQVYQAVKDEAIGHAVVKEGDSPALAHDATLAEQSSNSSPNAMCQIVEIKLALAPINNAEHLAPGVVGSYGTYENQQDK